MLSIFEQSLVAQHTQKDAQCFYNKRTMCPNYRIRNNSIFPLKFGRNNDVRLCFDLNVNGTNQSGPS